MSALAPIILFVYNRPSHTEQTLEALSNNELADQSVLYIYCDGPKQNATSEDVKNIEDVRQILEKKQWCREVIIREQDHNLGLANSVIQGVTQVIEKHGKVVVLEDDILTGTYFLKFMNEALDLYKNEQKVFGVSGYRFPTSQKIKEETFFLPIMSSWGYGTWKDRWKRVNFNGDELLDLIENKGIGDKLDFGNLKYYKMLKDQVGGKNDSWAIRFYVSMFLEKGVFLYPKQSLLKNIGFDGTGVHCAIDNSKAHQGKYQNEIQINVEKQEINLNSKVTKAFITQKVSAKNGYANKFKRKLSGLVAPEIKKYLRRKLGYNSNISSSNDFSILKKTPRYTRTKVFIKGVEIDIPDSASFLFMYKEIFQENIYRFKSSNPCPYIIDGGANIGLASIYLKLLYPDSEIVAFEPDPTIFDMLKSNIEAFSLRGVELIEKGLWNEDTSITFNSEGADAGLIATLDETLTATNSINVTSLRPFLNRTVDFLKLDIEGAETKVLKDIENDLKNVERIFVEYHSFIGQPQTLNDIINILTKANFRIYMSIPGNNALKSPLMGLRNYNNMDFQLNIFGYKEGNK
jgi:FkbM family methyltransferase|tara:strand:+ start:20286 stop:22010 length:1725 start_codon:yes stop_codon:yes gene_type:complete